MNILVITTGGTIGAEAYPDPGKPPEFSVMPPAGIDLVSDALQSKDQTVACISLAPRDSKLIDLAYRQMIEDHIKQAEAQNILITHGTDTLLLSADYFHQVIKDKTIILTGAMTPLANGPNSDGYMNLAFSIRQLQSGELASGVYMVLCDFERNESQDQVWKPKLYPYQPGAYQKHYAEDGRYNRLQSIAQPASPTCPPCPSSSTSTASIA